MLYLLETAPLVIALVAIAVYILLPGCDKDESPYMYDDLNGC